ncbi:MAG: DUF4390 domain-containing protein [Granulosicoccus sp.]
MSQQSDKPRTILMTASVLFATALVFVALVTLSVRGLNARVAESGDILLSQASLYSEGGQWFLDARADFKLPATVRSGLDSGVPLNFIMTLRFRSPRAFWFDKTLARHQQRFSINYYELTRHYRVHSLNTDISRNYRSLSSALDGLGQINDLHLALDNELGDLLSDESLLASLDFRLDTSALPLPLQPLITSSWRLASQELVWPVN